MHKGIYLVGWIRAAMNEDFLCVERLFSNTLVFMVYFYFLVR